MKQAILFAVLIVVSGLVVAPAPAVADSAAATCGVTKNGDYRPKSSGNCTFSQRQGYIDIDLANGRAYSLTPGNKPDHFKDGKGNKVVRSQSSGDEQVFQWDNGRQIVVTFDGGSERSNDRGSDKVAVRDMSRYCIGEAAAKFGRNPRDISTEEPVKDGSRYYMVWGQFPDKSRSQQFACTFMADGHYVGVDKK